MKKAIKLKMRVVKDLQDIDENTVLITSTGEEFCRTHKVLAVSSLSGNFVKAEWLDQSARAKVCLPLGGFLWIEDEVVETKFQFSILQSIKDGNHDRQSGGILIGYKVIVAGPSTPWKDNPIHNVKHLAEIAGAEVIDHQSIGDHDARSILILVANEEHASNARGGKISKAMEGGAKKITWTKFWDTLQLQKLDHLCGISTEAKHAPRLTVSSLRIC